MKKFLYLISASVFFFSCNIESEITKSTSAVLASDVTSIVINNSYIPIDIEGVSGDKIIFSAGGNITLYTNDKIINEPVIKISGNSALLYFQVFEDNQASFSFNSGASDKKRPWLRIQIPSSFSGELTVTKTGAVTDQEINAITAATITSKAVTGAVNEVLAAAQDLE